MKCAICGDEVPPDDPTYPKVHYDCSDRLYSEMEELGVIKVLSKLGTNISYRFTDSFQRMLDKSLDDVRFHTTTDETVDSDIVDMQGVIKAVQDYLPKGMPTRKLYRCAELVFNSLMMPIYGKPVPDDKRFHSRVREFVEEVTSIPISKEVAELWKSFRKGFN